MEDFQWDLFVFVVCAFVIFFFVKIFAKFPLLYYTVLIYWQCIITALLCQCCSVPFVPCCCWSLLRCVIVIVNVSSSQAVVKFCRDYNLDHTVPARRNCIFIIALPMGRTSRVCHLEALGRVLTGCVICSTMRCLLLPSNVHTPPTLGYIIHIACQSCAVRLV